MQVEREYVRLMSLGGEHTTFSETTIEYGYGIACKVAGEATLGGSLTAQVDFTVHGSTYDQTITTIKEWARTTGREEEYSKAWNEKEASGKAGFSFLFGLINVGGGGSYRDGTQNSKMKVTNTDNQFTKDLTNTLFDQKSQTIRCFGTINVIGQSQIPAKVSLAVEIMNITRNGQTIKVVNSGGLKVVDAQGNVVGKADPEKLNTSFSL